MAKKETKYIRTQMNTSNGIVPARINKETGEITPYSYRTAASDRVVVKSNGKDTEPFWMSFVGAEAKPWRTGEICSTKSVHNPYYGMLDKYDIYENRCGIGIIVGALEEMDEDQIDDAITSLVDNLPFMDNIFTGIANLGDHNPLSKNVMFNLLRALPEISSNTIYQHTTYSERYCQRLATALRVFIKLTADDI